METVQINTESVNMQSQPAGEGRVKGISGSTLKMIAIIVMLIDHIGAVILGKMIAISGIIDVIDPNNITEVMGVVQKNPGIVQIILLNFVLRLIGRLGFPIFCFLLIEGFLHTKNVWKYALRLGLFALISEIPFDLALYGKPFYFGSQNVFFTLLIGLLVMIVYDKIAHLENAGKALKGILYVAGLVLGMLVAQFLKTDYAAIGVFSIMVIYIFRKKKMQQIIAGCLVFAWEITAPLAFLPIAFYNGKRGWKMKYAFYIFYPLHLFILYLIALSMGIM